MNDFHILSICIDNKDISGCMRVFRDKSEFASRKILEKLRVRVTSHTGRAFWHWVQTWLLNACRREIKNRDSFCENASIKPVSGRDQSCRSGPGEGSGPDGHADRPRQHVVHQSTRSADVCAWPDGLPPVHAYMGDERAWKSRTSAAPRKPAVDVGNSDPARVHAGVPTSAARLCPEHPVRVCHRDAAAGPAASVREERTDSRLADRGRTGCSVDARELRDGRNGSGMLPGSHLLTDDGEMVPGSRTGGHLLTGMPQRYFASVFRAGGDAVVCHTADTVSAAPCRQAGTATHRQKWPALYAATLLLHSLCRPPVTGWSSAQSSHARKGIKATDSVNPGSAGKGRRDRQKPLQFDRFCLTWPSPCQAIPS